MGYFLFIVILFYRFYSLCRNFHIIPLYKFSVTFSPCFKLQNTPLPCVVFIGVDQKQYFLSGFCYSC
ncbi:Hypothetical protein ETEE_1014 [Edwardsiella anguillarum ET080813]|uniref:Uncharacterized protein n=1 Tax=Edwardsiella anguillarum ET080813 TaxID=667120 RepID=A0A076LP81_9GAMM|nr:Hypothetical protein ETEE_1014 [Edwardsiella anguillarum ET080813]